MRLRCSRSGLSLRCRACTPLLRRVPNNARPPACKCASPPLRWLPGSADAVCRGPPPPPVRPRGPNFPGAPTPRSLLSLSLRSGRAVCRYAPFFFLLGSRRLGRHGLGFGCGCRLRLALWPRGGLPPFPSVSLRENGRCLLVPGRMALLGRAPRLAAAASRNLDPNPIGRLSPSGRPSPVAALPPCGLLGLAAARRSFAPVGQTRQHSGIPRLRRGLPPFAWLVCPPGSGRYAPSGTAEVATLRFCRPRVASVPSLWLRPAVGLSRRSGLASSCVRSPSGKPSPPSGAPSQSPARVPPARLKVIKRSARCRFAALATLGDCLCLRRSGALPPIPRRGLRPQTPGRGFSTPPPPTPPFIRVNIT